MEAGFDDLMHGRPQRDRGNVDNVSGDGRGPDNG